MSPDENIQERWGEDEIVLTLAGVDDTNVLTGPQQQSLRDRRAEIEAEEWKSAKPRRVRVPQLSL